VVRKRAMRAHSGLMTIRDLWGSYRSESLVRRRQDDEEDMKDEETEMWRDIKERKSDRPREGRHSPVLSDTTSAQPCQDVKSTEVGGRNEEGKEEEERRQRGGREETEIRGTYGLLYVVR